MGNILSECRKCTVEQCELCTEVVGVRSGQPRTTRHAPLAPDSEAELTGSSARTGGRRGQEFQPTDMSEAAMIQQAIRNSQADRRGAERGSLLSDEDPTLMAAIAASVSSNGGSPSDDELLAQAMRRAKNEEASREAARLREEQEREYQESLRIDQQRELEKALRKKEEEEAERRAAEEAEGLRRKAEEEAAEAAKAEEARKRRAQEAMDEAREKLGPEPAKGEAGRVEVMIRTPGGRRFKRGFLGSDLVAQLYHFANLEGGEDIASSSYRLVSSMPRNVYEDRESTLEAAGLKGQSALLMEVIEDDN